ncbi:hypothetical protein ACVMFA_009457 [Bradyrhizobium liaoningense]
MPDTSFLARISDDWVRTALSSRKLFGDGSPQWANLPSRSDALEERAKRIRLFRKHHTPHLAAKLAACLKGTPCASGACPVCTRALQRHLVSEAFPILQPTSDFVTVSLVPNVRISPSTLSQLPIVEFTENVGERLNRGKISFCVGGVDFSFNESRRGDFPSHWSPHIWLLTDKFNRARWEMRLRHQFERSRAAPRPVKIQDWDGDLAAIGYSLKYEFKRRISKMGRRSQDTRICKITSYDRLRSHERFELYSYLHRIGLGSRILLMGVETDNPPHLTISYEK